MGDRRTCTDCGLEKDLAAFTPIRGTPYTHTRCKPCRAGRERAKRALTAKPRPPKPPPPPKKLKPQWPEGHRQCTDCGEVKPLAGFLFYKKWNCYYGRCRACRNLRKRSAEERAKRSLSYQKRRERDRLNASQAAPPAGILS